ncbi:Transcription factor MEIS1 and related HOX domain proteins [Phaffia rhodozyma]|uniref:Transcription factor MEIS1 and related HOX domain proteins n=1 Tax=Phaffia rhodozyma TaxID=264483 RepID=A0A0F7SFU2_PHARH|nr:Transcription factor MEIS1 and related HOX domain proteins [Phaffia rhodozyma]
MSAEDVNWQSTNNCTSQMINHDQLEDCFSRYLESKYNWDDESDTGYSISDFPYGSYEQGYEQDREYEQSYQAYPFLLESFTQGNIEDDTSESSSENASFSSLDEVATYDTASASSLDDCSYQYEHIYAHPPAPPSFSSSPIEEAEQISYSSLLVSPRKAPAYESAPSPSYSDTSAESTQEMQFNTVDSELYENSWPGSLEDKDSSVDHPSAQKRSRAARKTGSRYLPMNTTAALNDWYVSSTHKYPPRELKIKWCEETGLSRTQLDDWFINRRRRDKDFCKQPKSIKRSVPRGSTAADKAFSGLKHRSNASRMK